MRTTTSRTIWLNMNDISLSDSAHHKKVISNDFFRITYLFVSLYLFLALFPYKFYRFSFLPPCCKRDIDTIHEQVRAQLPLFAHLKCSPIWSPMNLNVADIRDSIHFMVKARSDINVRRAPKGRFRISLE